MRTHVLFLLSWALVVSSLPAGELTDDDEPFADLESGLDLIAEESEPVETVVAPPSIPRLRGGVRFSATPERFSRPRIRKVTTPPPEEVRGEKDLMLVLPFDTKNLTESKIEELYTRRPVTYLVSTTTTQPPPITHQTEGTTLVVTPTPLAKWPVTTTTTTTPAPLVIRDDVKELLASIGLFPPEIVTTTTPEPDMRDLLASFGLLPPENEIPHASGAKFSTPRSVQPQIDASSYSVFKPIPTSEVGDEMSHFLAGFGLVTERHERAKKLSPTPEPTREPTANPEQQFTLHPDSMSAEMRHTLQSLGLLQHLNTEQTTEQYPQARSINSEFIFNPTDSVQNALNNTEDVKSLNKLLDTFKILSKNVSSPEELEQQLQDATKYLSKNNFSKVFSDKNKTPLTLDDFANTPDPLSFDELLYAINETRNGVNKRQQVNASRGYSNSKPDISFDLPSSTTRRSTEATASTDFKNSSPSAALSEGPSSESSALSDTSSESSTKSADSAVSEDTSSPSLADLESSFGGSTGGTVDESLPPPKPNGFYFMLDWNSFLNVGEDDKGVHLRFAPRFGNSKNFLPITVP